MKRIEKLLHLILLLILLIPLSLKSMDINNDNIILYQSYPNPFKSETAISFSYSISQDSKVILGIYNIIGQKIKTLVHKNQQSGFHNVIWNGTDNNNKTVPSGVYFYRITTIPNQKSVTKKKLLIK